MSTSASAADVPVPSASTSSVGGTASAPPSSAFSSSAIAAEVLTADEELQLGWEVFGFPELYEAPTEQELNDLSDGRHRNRQHIDREPRS